MTAKTLEKVPVNLGGFVHPAADSVYCLDEVASSLPASVAIFPNSELGAHYDHMNVAPGKIAALRPGPFGAPHLFTCYPKYISSSKSQF